MSGGSPARVRSDERCYARRTKYQGEDGICSQDHFCPPSTPWLPCPELIQLGFLRECCSWDYMQFFGLVSVVWTCFVKMSLELEVEVSGVR